MSNRNFPLYKIILICTLTAIIIAGVVQMLRIRSAQENVQYEEFIEREMGVAPSFDVLNHEVFQVLPIPSQAQEVSRYDTGGPSIHGRQIFATYVLPTSESVQQVLDRFNAAMLTNGWMQYENYDEGNTHTRQFIKGTACVFATGSSDSHYLQITVWHDFLRQSFSLTLPPPGLLEQHEFGETMILRCPPE